MLAARNFGNKSTLTRWNLESSGEMGSSFNLLDLGDWMWLLASGTEMAAASPVGLPSEKKKKWGIADLRCHVLCLVICQSDVLLWRLMCLLSMLMLFFRAVCVDMAFNDILPRWLFTWFATLYSFCPPGNWDWLQHCWIACRLPDRVKFGFDTLPG
ncbi:hypothetical protein Nepgr_030906 [Nepenthes gracilis]|uniref:Uncharacterized protein n=1 Tax=Nepenthes gracilis TaxID=150966 RepID=A0AAD3THF6_NEPGR|nr:hypothetical protein Nepgr_030906 [Nepenthes gracilis]